MDKSNNVNLKISPVIIKLSKNSDETVVNSDPLHVTPNSVKPISFELKLTKDDIQEQSSSHLSDKLGIIMGERKSATGGSSSIKRTFGLTCDTAVEISQRRSLTSHLSKLCDNKLDSVNGGGKSEVPEAKPPLVKQPSNLHTDHMLDAGHGGGEMATSASLQPSHSLPLGISRNATSSKESANQEPDLEPTKKKIKLCSTVKDNVVNGNSNELCALSAFSSKFKTGHTEEESRITKEAKPPLVMQPSNLLSENMLDVRHGGGGVETSKSQQSTLRDPHFELKSVCSQEADELSKPKVDTITKVKEILSENGGVNFSEAKSIQPLVTTSQLSKSPDSISNVLCDKKKELAKCPSVRLPDLPIDNALNGKCKINEPQSNSALTECNARLENACTAKNLDNKDSDKILVDDQESCRSLGAAGASQEAQSDDYSTQMDSQNGTEDPVMEFDILDEFESNENDPEEMNSDDDTEISADEIDAMLDEGLGAYGRQNGLGGDLQHEERQKVILKVRGRDHFEVLPEGWIEVTHNSGMPIYLHKQSRVCCVSKPYFLGPGSTRKHEIPISAIPCLHYLKQLEKEREAESKVGEEESVITQEESVIGGKSEDNNEIPKSNSEVPESKSDISENRMKVSDRKPEILKDKMESSENRSGISGNSSAANPAKVTNLIFPSAKLESVKDTKMLGSLDYLAVREYCEKRFEFQTITVKRFKTWYGRRRHQKQLKRKQRPFLPDSTQLITCPLPSSMDKSTTVGNTSKREFIMNPTGKSPVCILHEYVQHTLRVQPRYIFKELESASTPYGAVVLINDMEYGTGYGSSKKVAKSEAAKSALEVLIPKIKTFAPEKHSDEDELQDVEFFDQVRVEDPRVSDLSVKAGQPYPYQILLECLKRNYGMGDTEVSITMKNLKHQKNEFLMKVGKHKATVVCKNKRDGKHRASQSILQQLHPHINSWGSLLRMYGKGSCKTLKEKKEEEQRITELQSKACVNKPNQSILNKLKEEMLKYREKMKSKKPIGKLIPEKMRLFTVSDSNLKSIEL